VALDVDQRLVDRAEHERLDDVRVAREVESELQLETGVAGGVVREVGDGGGQPFGLEQLGSEIEGELAGALDRLGEGVTGTGHPLVRLVAACALARTETRGAHLRLDFPRRDDALDGLHIVVAPDREPVSTRWR
jgi:hypothetical protein